MSDSFEYASVEHFTAGTVGPKGQRTFFLQFGNPGAIVSLKLEKAQVAALADYLDQILEEAGPVSQEDIALALDLIEPVEAAWVVASMGVAWHEDTATFVVIAEELVTEEDEGENPESATVELHLSPGQVSAFVERARDLVAAGRPPCQYCGRPLNHDDNWCACFN